MENLHFLSEENYNVIDNFMNHAREFVDIASQEFDTTYLHAMEGLNMENLIENSSTDWYNYSPKNLYSYILNETQIRLNE